MSNHGEETDNPGLPTSPAPPQKQIPQRRLLLRKPREYNYLRQIIVFGISLLIILAPLSLGGRGQLAWGCMGIGLAVLFAVWVLRSWLRGKIEYWKSPVYLGFFILLALTMVQILPLGDWLGIFSPAAASHWRELERVGIGAGARTISLLPAETFNCIFLILMALGMFFLVTNSFTTRRSLFILALAIISSATINAAIGMVEQFGSGKKSFWYLGISPYSITGTFINKNHFALLLEMGILVAMGLAMTAIFAHSQRIRERDSARALLDRHQAFFTLAAVLPLMAMLVALLFSFSRAGTLCVFLAVIAFSLLAIHYSGRSLRITGILAAIAVVFIIASSRGLDYIWRRFEALASGESMSGAVRWDLWKSSLSLLGRHWFTGVGFAAYRYTSPRFESGPVPDSIAFYAHNDWLEFFCEFGIPAALLMLAILVYSIAKIAIRLHRRHDFVAKWLGLGALFALLAVAGHEVFDYGLRMHGNMLICVSILALATICGYIPGNDELKPGPELRAIKLSPIKRRIFLIGGLGLVIAFILAILPVALAGTSLAHLKARVSPFARHKMATPEKEAQYRIELSSRILSYCPDNTQALMQRAENNAILATLELQNTEAKTLGIPREKIYNLKSYEKLNAVMRRLPDPIRKEISTRLDSAVADLRQACRLAPTNGQYLGLYARARERAGIFHRNLNESNLQKIYALAHKSYPRVARVTLLCANGAWRKFLRQDKAGAQTRRQSFNRALRIFAEAITQSPYLAPKVYDTVYFILPDPDVLSNLTPYKLLPREILFRYLFRLREFAACLKELYIINILNKKRADVEKAELGDTYEFFRHDWRSKEEVALSVQKREIVLLGLTGRWQERSQRLALLREKLRPVLNKSLSVAENLVAAGRLHRASSRLRKLLEIEPFYPQAILTQAKVFQLLGESEKITRLLLILAYTGEPVETGILNQALAIIGQPAGGKGAEPAIRRFPVKRFLRAALTVKSGRAEAGLAQLRELIAGRENQEIPIWIQEHLLYYFAGQALEKLGRPEEALREYALALKLCPQHLPSAKRSARLINSRGIPENLKAGGTSEGLGQVLQEALAWLQTVKPKIPVDVDFGGKFRLLGYTVRPEIIPPGGLFEITFYWYCEGDIENEYAIGCYYSQGRERAFTDTHFIRGIGFDMVGWRVGEVIEVTRKVSPSYLATRQKRPEIKPGLYDLHVKPYARDLKARKLLPLVECRAPAFEVKAPPAPAPGLD